MKKKVYLFCHGMMLFWYRRRTSESADGYRILIPQAPVHPMHPGHGQHEFLIGAEPKACHSPLHYADHPEPTKFYELRFGAATTVRPRGIKDCSLNLGLYEKPGHCKAEPNYGFDEPGGVAFAIDIPYPAADKQLRVEEYKEPVFMSGYTREDFQLYPKKMPRSNLFTFEVENADVPVVLQNKLDPSDCHVLAEFGSCPYVKLYLYSGPPNVIPQAGQHPIDHLSVFNELLRYGNHKRLDLVLNKQKVDCTMLDPATIPAPFTRDDYRHLGELNDNLDFCGSPSAGANPAECSQGGGC